VNREPEAHWVDEPVDSIAEPPTLARAVALVVSALVAGPRMVCSESKTDLAKATVKKYAFEAYPSWRAQHRSEACPERLDDLDEYMNNKDVTDPWDGVYEMSCSEYGILVWTAGEDGRAGTGDDIRSDL
jgi:hypothetical protein